MANPLLDFRANRGRNAQRQSQPFDTQKAQNQWQNFLSQYGSCNPDQMLDQFEQQGLINRQQRGMVMGIARTLTGLFHL